MSCFDGFRLSQTQVTSTHKEIAHGVSESVIWKNLIENQQSLLNCDVARRDLELFTTNCAKKVTRIL